MKESEKNIMKTLEGNLVSKEIRVGIVVARFNEFITSKLLGGAMDGLLRHNVAEDDIHVAWVPGAFEIPLVASKMAKSGKYDAVMLDRDFSAAVHEAGGSVPRNAEYLSAGALDLMYLAVRLERSFLYY